MLITEPYLSRFNPAIDMHYFAGYAGYLVLGHYLAFKTFDVRYLRLWMLLLFLFSAGLITIGSRLLINQHQYPDTMLYEPVNPAVLMLSVSVFLLVKFTVPKVSPAIIRFRDFAGRYNYGIYLAHALVLYFLDDLTGISYHMGKPLWSIPLTALICFILTLLLVWLINKIPFGKWISG